MDALVHCFWLFTLLLRCLASLLFSAVTPLLVVCEIYPLRPDNHKFLNFFTLQKRGTLALVSATNFQKRQSLDSSVLQSVTELIPEYFSLDWTFKDKGKKTIVFLQCMDYYKVKDTSDCKALNLSSEFL